MAAHNKVVFTDPVLETTLDLTILEQLPNIERKLQHMKREGRVSLFQHENHFKLRGPENEMRQVQEALLKEDEGIHSVLIGGIENDYEMQAILSGRSLGHKQKDKQQKLCKKALELELVIFVMSVSQNEKEIIERLQQNGAELRVKAIDADKVLLLVHGPEEKLESIVEYLNQRARDVKETTDIYSQRITVENRCMFFDEVVHKYHPKLAVLYGVHIHLVLKKGFLEEAETFENEMFALETSSVFENNDVDVTELLRRLSEVSTPGIECVSPERTHPETSTKPHDVPPAPKASAPVVSAPAAAAPAAAAQPASPASGGTPQLVSEIVEDSKKTVLKKNEAKSEPADGIMKTKADVKKEEVKLEPVDEVKRVTFAPGGLPRNDSKTYKFWAPSTVREPEFESQIPAITESANMFQVSIIGIEYPRIVAHGEKRNIDDFFYSVLDLFGERHVGKPGDGFYDKHAPSRRQTSFKEDRIHPLFRDETERLDSGEGIGTGPLQTPTTPPTGGILRQGATKPFPRDEIEKQHKRMHPTVMYLMKTYQHPGTKIRVHCGVADITKLYVDCIVNATNERMEHHFGGISLAISKAAGYDLELESAKMVTENGVLDIADVYVTGAGKLPCKKVLHTMGPVYSEVSFNDEKCVDELQNAYTNCLKKAEEMKMTSIAVPAISSGVATRVPIHLVCRAACEAMCMFCLCQNDRETAIKDIYFVDIAPDTIFSFNSLFTDQVVQGAFEAKRNYHEMKFN